MDQIEREKIMVFDMKCLKKILGVRVMQRIKNRDVRKGCGNKSLSWDEWTKVH